MTSDTLIPRLVSAGQGVSGKLIRIGGTSPVWAAEGHRSFCRTVEGFNGSFFVKKPCGELKAAASYYGKAKADRDPPETVEAAGRMKSLSETLVASARTAACVAEVIGSLRSATQVPDARARRA